MKAGVLVFPGSNCDHDAYHVLSHRCGLETRFVWHKEKDIDELDLILVPGGFSYGDYLRSGAIARFSPVMKAVVDHANKGKPVLGICNGFQILLEAGLLPGAMLHNNSVRFVCRSVYLRTETNETMFTSTLKPGDVLEMPIAHGEGNYFADKATLDALNEHEQIVFRYCDAVGSLTKESNPNGASEHIAGICNKNRNVLGMMPHPERAADPLLGKEDGMPVFESLLHVVG